MLPFTLPEGDCKGLMLAGNIVLARPVYFCDPYYPSPDENEPRDPLRYHRTQRHTFFVEENNKLTTLTHDTDFKYQDPTTLKVLHYHFKKLVSGATGRWEVVVDIPGHWNF